MRGLLVGFLFQCQPAYRAGRHAKSMPGFSFLDGKLGGVVEAHDHGQGALRYRVKRADLQYHTGLAGKLVKMARFSPGTKLKGAGVEVKTVFPF